jgi:hypothetical protein
MASGGIAHQLWSHLVDVISPQHSLSEPLSFGRLVRHQETIHMDDSRHVGHVNLETFKSQRWPLYVNLTAPANFRLAWHSSKKAELMWEAMALQALRIHLARTSKKLIKRSPWH